MVIPRGLTRAVAVLCLALSPAVARAQAAATSTPAFSLESDHVSTTRERPKIRLTFRRISSLDFRIYRVRDPLEFFTRLRDPHALGSEKSLVPQERTWLERLAIWKASMRDRVRYFFRRELSAEYRMKRREVAARQQVQLRRTISYRTFTQVPLLNPSQLVTSWREMLPMTRGTDDRQIPLELTQAGVYVVEAVSGPLKAYTVVVISDLGIITKAAPGQVLAYVVSRSSGDPVAGCDIRTVAKQKVLASGTTAADGTWQAAIAGQGEIEGMAMVARCGDKIAVADPGGWFLQGNARELVGYVYTDRPIYRPGHTVNIKAVLRWRAQSVLGPFDAKQVELTVADNNDKVLLRQQLPVDEFGTVRTSFAIPAAGALGDYIVTVKSGTQETNGSFEVQEYRKPEFDVGVRAEQKFVLQGGTAAFTVSARYYFGQPVAQGAITYVVRRHPYFSPWRWSDEENENFGEDWYGGEQTSEGKARLDASGNATIRVALPADDKGHDYSTVLEARVTDASGREVSGQTSVNATFGRFMLTVHTGRYLEKPGDQAQAEVRAIDYDGQPQANVRLDAALERTEYRSGEGRVTTGRIAETLLTTGADGRATWDVTLPNEAGSYAIQVSTSVDGRRVQDDALCYVTGRSSYDAEEEYLDLVPDQKTYRAGDTARLMIRGAKTPASVLVTKEADTVTYHHVVPFKPGDLVEVPIVDDDCGDTYVSIAYLKDDRMYRAEKRLTVPADSRRLQVTIDAESHTTRPGQMGRFTLAVADAAGRPVKAQLSVGVVDEALYGVKTDATPDPLRFFYRREYSKVGTEFSRGYSFVGYSGTQQLLLTQRRRRPMTLADFKADRPERPQVRKNFPDAIFWNASVVTDAAGKAHVELPYPDSLTTWRMTVRAVTADTLVGGVIARTLTTKDLIVRVITPRFLTEGDESDIPTVVHNFQSTSRDVRVTTAVSGLTPLGSATPQAGAGAALPPGTHFTIASGGEQRTDQQFKADKVGTVSVTATATTEGASDAMEMSLPVLPYGLKRVAAAAGSMSGTGEADPVLTLPDRSNPAARTIRVSLAPSMAGSLLGALDFLTSYPYGCTEQTLSSFVPNLVVLRALAQLKLAPTERLTALDRQVSEGLTRLYDYQHDDGGFGWWKTDENDPFMTAYAMQGLLEAKAAGYKIDESRIYRGNDALEKLYREYPRALPDLKAYEAYVIERIAAAQESAAAAEGAPDGRRSARPARLEQNEVRDRFDELWNARSRMSNYGRALLLLALQAVQDQRRTTLEQELLKNATVKGDVASWTADFDPLLYEPIDSSVEATALAVRGLVVNHARDPILEKAVRWLLLERGGGYYWSSTKQTAMVLYGLLDYMRARGEQPAPSTVDVFVNDTLVATRAFTETDFTAPNPVVMTAPAIAGNNRIRVVHHGAGTVYWSAEAQYYQLGGQMEATGSRKLALSRLYSLLSPVQKNGRTVYREVPFPGTANPGDVIAVRLTAAGSKDWRHLMIEDPIPAGTEPVKQQSFYELETGQPWGWEQREFRDDRVVFFQEDFGNGRYEYVYLLKVTTPGRFKAMPAQIAPMYMPGVSASTDPQGVIVTPLTVK